MNRHLTFTVASSPGHYGAAHQLMRSEGVEQKQSLSFPTVMAWDGDALVGICGTRIVDKMILGGPLVVRTDHRRLFTIMRLCEAYEEAMKNIGIESFILSVEHGSILHRGMERYHPHLRPYATEDGSDFYVWKVKGYGNQSQRAASFTGGARSTEESGGTLGAATPGGGGTASPEPHPPAIPGGTGGV